MGKLVAIVFWFASISLIFVSLYPLKRNLEGGEIPSITKEKAVTVLSLVVSMSFIILVLVFKLEGMGRKFYPVDAIAPLVSLLGSLFWWKSIIKIQRKNLDLSSLLVIVVVILFIIALVTGLMMTVYLWRHS
ncbi:MAG: hypothetical protein Q7I97_01555 [Thermovirgaceae bacterium]|nr:hypothetical protein [Thermovirgaceae bacterium]